MTYFADVDSDDAWDTVVSHSQIFWEQSCFKRNYPYVDKTVSVGEELVINMCYRPKVQTSVNYVRGRLYFDDVYRERHMLYNFEVREKNQRGKSLSFISPRLPLGHTKILTKKDLNVIYTQIAVTLTYNSIVAEDYEVEYFSVKYSEMFMPFVAVYINLKRIKESVI